MTLRPGSQGAIHFLSHSERAGFTNLGDWEALEKCYPICLAAIAKKKETALRKSAFNLVQLDVRLRGSGFRDAVLARDPPHLFQADLSDIVRWKLNRGKMRPLQKVCDGNGDVNVRAVTVKALSLAAKGAQSCTLAGAGAGPGKGYFMTALSELAKLRGVGPATASLVLSLLFPQVPFMADEVLDCVCGSREYSAREAEVLLTSLTAVAACIGSGWTAERVGSALWVCATAVAHGLSLPASVATIIENEGGGAIGTGGKGASNSSSRSAASEKRSGGEGEGKGEEEDEGKTKKRRRA